MKTHLRTLGVTLLAAGTLAVPTAAYAAEGPALRPLVELDAAGKTVRYPIKPGETIPVVLGVHNSGATAVNGVAVDVYTLDDLDLPREFTNCQYYVDSNKNGAWCLIDQELAAGAQAKLSPFHIVAAPDAKKTASIVFRWYTADWAAEQGGIAALAKKSALSGEAAGPGTGGTVALAESNLPIEGQPQPAIGFAYTALVTPPTTPTTPPTSEPTTETPTATPSSPATTAPGAGGDNGGDGGGLPVTGSKTAAVAGLGTLLLLGGAVGVILVRRRRTRFVA